LKTLLHAGLPLAQSMSLLKDQQTEPHFRALLNKVHQQTLCGEERDSDNGIIKHT